MRPSSLGFAWILAVIIVCLRIEEASASACNTLSERKCSKEGALSGCLWYSDLGLCRLAPYCSPTWDNITCESLANIGACEFIGGVCVARTTPLGSVNLGLDCRVQCNPLALEAFPYNEQCSYCGSQGFCCDTANPQGCKPQGCTTAVCCAIPGTNSPSQNPSAAPSRSPVTSKPSAGPTKSPTLIPTSKTPTMSPTIPTKSPIRVPTPSPTLTPSFGPSTSSPSSNPTPNPSFTPSFQPSLSPSLPTRHPTQSPTPTSSPTVFVPMNPDDQLAWRTFRDSFADKSYCGNSAVNACNACQGQTSANRRIICEIMPIGQQAQGRRRRLQSQATELRIIEIRLRNSNLSGALPIRPFVDSLPFLRVLDLSNDGPVDENNIVYIGEGSCLPLSSCSSGAIQCNLPPSLPPLCASVLGQQQSSATIPMFGYVGIGVGVAGLFLVAFLLLLYTRRGKRKKSMRPRKSGASHASSRQSMASTGSRGGDGTSRKVSFTKNPALVFTPDPNKPAESGTKRRRSSVTARQKRQWKEEWDASTGQAFYVNRKTGEFSWTAPGETPKEERILPPPSYPHDDDDDDIMQRVPVIAQPAKRATKAQRRSATPAEAEYDDSVWETVFDESSNTRFMVHTLTGEFVMLPPGMDEALVRDNLRQKSRDAYATNGDADEKNDDDEDDIGGSSSSSEGNHDPLWKPEFDEDTGDMYWIDVESGTVSFTEPTIGTIVSAEMLEATGRYNLGQVYMKKPSFVKKPAPDVPNRTTSPNGPVDVRSEPRRSSSNLHTFMPPRRSSGLEALDLGSRKSLSSLDGRGSWVRKSAPRTPTHSNVLDDGSDFINSEAVQVHVRSDEDSDDDDSDDDDSDDSDNSDLERRRRGYRRQ